MKTSVLVFMLMVYFEALTAKFHNKRVILLQYLFSLFFCCFLISVNKSKWVSVAFVINTLYVIFRVSCLHLRRDSEDFSLMLVS